MEIVEFTHSDKAFRFPTGPTRDYIVGRIEATKSFYEIDLLSYLDATVEKVGLALDCGANIGNHSVYFSGVMGLKTHAFEPVRRNRELLQRAIEENNLGDLISIHPFALGDEDGEVYMQLPAGGNEGMYQAVSSGEGEIVKMITLDGFLSDKPELVSLIKIDVEGFELNVLRGALKTIERSKPTIVAEFHSYAEFSQVLEILLPLGYAEKKIFGATPTVVFEQSSRGKIRAIKTWHKLRAHERKVKPK